MNKNFYHHLISTNSLFIEIDQLAIEDHEKNKLKKLAENNIHFTIITIVLAELSEKNQKLFLKHALTSDHDTTWKFLKSRTTNLEPKITSAVENLIAELHADIQESKNNSSSLFRNNFFLGILQRMGKVKSKRARQKKQKELNLWKKYSRKITLLSIGVLSCLVTILFFALHAESNSTPIVERPIQQTLPPDIRRQLTLTPPKTVFHVPILMYHYIEYVQDRKDTERQALNIIPATFDLQIKTLKDAGYTFMTAAELGDVLNGKTTLPDKPVVITIDDGHWDVDTDILPILKKYNVKVTAYIIPGFIGGSDFLSEKQLDDLADSGLVEIGAHTVHHAYLRDMGYDNAKYEIEESKIMLEKDLHRKVVSFAYPYGAFDQQAADLAKEAGFETAVSTVPGIDVSQQNRYFLYRLRPGYRTGQELINFISQDQPFYSLPVAPKKSAD